MGSITGAMTTDCALRPSQACWYRLEAGELIVVENWFEELKTKVGN